MDSKLRDDSQTQDPLLRWHECGDYDALRQFVSDNLASIREQVGRRLSLDGKAAPPSTSTIHRALKAVLLREPRFVAADRSLLRRVLARIIANDLQCQPTTQEQRSLPPQPAAAVLKLEPPGIQRALGTSPAADQRERNAWRQLANDILGPAHREELRSGHWEHALFGNCPAEPEERQRYEALLPRLARSLARLRAGRLDATDR